MSEKKLCLPKAIFGEIKCDGRCDECVMRLLAEKLVIMKAIVASMAMMAAKVENMANCMNELCETIKKRGGDEA